MVQKFNAINLVVQYLRQGILSGNWPIGEKIPSENEICKTLNVSRSSVRCALAQYIAMGILKSIHGKGTYVCSTQLSSVGSGKVSDALRQALVTLLEFRRMLEPDICYYAASKVTDSQLKELEDTLFHMGDSASRSEMFVYYDCCFHEQIAEFSGNCIASQTLKNLFQDNLVYLLDMNRALGSCNAYYYHASLLEILQKRDCQKARQLMRDHLEKSLSELLIS